MTLLFSGASNGVKQNAHPLNFPQYTSNPVAHSSKSVQRGLESDNDSLAVVKGDFITFKNSSAQDVLIAEESDGHIIYCGKANEYILGRNPL